MIELTNDSKITKLEALAKDLLNLKQESIPRRPIVIEFAGSPKSGKTSCINSLAMFLRRNKFRTKVLTERASVCPVVGKHDPLFNTWTMASSVAELSELLANNSKDYDVILMDRGFFDSLCWFNWLYSKNFIDPSNYESTCNFLKLRRWRSVIDLVYVFTVKPHEAIKREQATLLTKKTGSIMQPEILESIKAIICNTEEEGKKMYRNLEKIDTTETEPMEVNYSVTERTLEILKEKISERIGYIPRSSLRDELPTAFSFSKAEINGILPQYGKRKDIEESKDKVQLIPIVVITNHEKSNVVVVRKKDNAAKGSAESGKLLLYFGGHLREEDGQDGEDFLTIMKYGLSRELKEEAGIDYFPHKDQKDPICIWDRGHEKSSRHLAICFLMKTDPQTTKIRLDTNEFEAGKAGEKSGSFEDVQELKEEYLEKWSAMILQKILKTSTIE